ncbi:MAG: DUF4834 family protein [Lentimicrobium sp.]|nr:DUF4834 family protein [Lentimicrobium sp.]MDD2526728.1 hypothetical protein [Lentimicrobiaceae bacterium]MDD4596452.1 hypothetical protein [Lentimicrobiaceae bacterium]MDY0024694.1 hypothetical protein [Lentimicrobium sp.]HAH57875.1 hypothetical protein [Bacteroidales bacterium]
MGLIKFLLIIFAFYLFFRVFTSVILPFIVKRSLKRFQDKFYQRNPHVRNPDKTKEGEVTIKDPGHQDEVNIPEDFGEYIDYEDIK